VAEIRLARVSRLIPRIAEVSFGHDPKRPNGRERSTVLAIQFVSVITVEHALAFRATRQFETGEEWVSRIIDVSLARITIAAILVAVARIVLLASRAWTAPQFDPRHVYVSRIVALQISRIEIMIHKTPPSLSSDSRAPRL